MKKIVLVLVIIPLVVSLTYIIAFAKDRKITLTATASSVYYNNPSFGADKAVDGEINTYWLGEANLKPWWIVFDADSKKRIDTINIKWFSSYYAPQDYDIQISDDGTNWVNLASHIRGVYSAGGDVRDVGRDGRYVRLYIRDAGYYPCLRELAAYEKIKVPRLVRFQGTLGDAEGAPINGAHTITFRIYNEPSGAAVLWTETQDSVNIGNGLLDVELGSVTPLDNLSFDEEYWLGIEIESDGEMTPRFKLTTVPYAVNSEE